MPHDDPHAQVRHRPQLPPGGQRSVLGDQPELAPETNGEHQLLLGIPDAREGEAIELDFSAVDVLTPSFAEEFIIGLLENYPRRVQFSNTNNVTVRTTLDFLARQWPDLMPIVR